ncbi:transcriptional regulator [Flagellimonas aquimarina]|uniref:Transcriptional regulator n=1 Tax=Flagellimonas aquimarina TaxID=2201895 RepID=A0A316L618_9FLAO|nr:transcriptional repressor [Allomuricauda koreensis]PWL39703.1 transcriptional regulator [Allomuricauda koreensis]
MKRRQTHSTQEILELLKAENQAMNHEMIQSKLDSQVNRATIYRVLNRFCEDGIVHKIVGDDGKQYFAFCLNCTQKTHNHNHFHFRCTQCGKVECLEKEASISLPEGYVLENFNGLISGTCNDCT